MTIQNRKFMRPIKRRIALETLQIRLDKKTLDLVDDLVNKGIFESRSDCCREIVGSEVRKLKGMQEEQKELKL